MYYIKACIFFPLHSILLASVFVEISVLHLLLAKSSQNEYDWFANCFKFALGTAFYPLQSCMNHSCCPNAHAFKRDEVCLRSKFGSQSHTSSTPTMCITLYASGCVCFSTNTSVSVFIFLWLQDRDGQAAIITLKPIRKGEEVIHFIHYIQFAIKRKCAFTYGCWAGNVVTVIFRLPFHT